MSSSQSTPFHLAFAVTDIAATERFFVDLLGCSIGRRAERWIDFDFFGHQVSAHLVDGELAAAETNPVDGEKVPSRHFGAILEWDQWHELSAKLQKAEIEFLLSQPSVLKVKLANRQQCSFAIRLVMRLNSNHSKICRRFLQPNQPSFIIR